MSQAGVWSVRFLSALQLKFMAPPAQITQLRIKHRRRSAFKRRKHRQEPGLGQMMDPNQIREAQIDVIRNVHVHRLQLDNSDLLLPLANLTSASFMAQSNKPL